MRDGSELVGWGMASGVWEALQMPGLLLECRGDPAKAIAAQVSFAERAGAHYLEAACRLMALASQVARDCWWPGTSERIATA